MNKTLLILAAALACAAAPASAQKAAKSNEDGTLYCSNPNVTLRELPNGGYALNYTQALQGDAKRVQYASGAAGLFDDPDPVIDLYYSARWDDAANEPEYFSASTVGGTFGTVAKGRDLPPDTLRILIDSGALRSPPLTLATAARDGNYIGAALVAPKNALDANDVETDWDSVGALADALAKRGGTLTLTDANGRVIASVQIPPGDAEHGRPAAVDFAKQALPMLKQGKCPY